MLEEELLPAACQVFHLEFEPVAIRPGGHVVRHQQVQGIPGVLAPGIPEYLLSLSLLNIRLLYHLHLSILVYAFPFHHALSRPDVVIQK